MSPPGTKISDGLWYAAFCRGEQASSDSPEFTVFKPGPTLLAFAQLLLEIEEGKKINLESGKDTSDSGRWPKLILRAAEAERAGCGLYAEAVKGCLYFHIYLALELESQGPSPPDLEGCRTHRYIPENRQAPRNSSQILPQAPRRNAAGRIPSHHEDICQAQIQSRQEVHPC